MKNITKMLLCSLVFLCLSFSVYAQSFRQHGFGPGQKWHDEFGFGSEIQLVGDFNGDGLDDIATFTRGTRGDVYVALSNGSGFKGTSVKWHDNLCFGNQIPLTGDVDRDGKDDIIVFDRGTTGDVYAAVSTGSSFKTHVEKWHELFCIGNEVPFVADVDGDRRADIVTFVRSTKTGQPEGDVYVSLSNGNGFGQASLWHEFFCIGNETPKVADVTGDGKADILAFVRSTKTGQGKGDVLVAVSDGRKFKQASLWHEYFCIGNEIPLVADVTGDGKADILTFVRSTKTGHGEGDVVVSVSEGNKFGHTSNWHEYFCLGNEIPLTGRFNDDLNADIVTFLRSNGTSQQHGDVYVALTGDMTEDISPYTKHLLGYGEMGDQLPGKEERPLLVILLEAPASMNKPQITTSKNTYRQKIFGNQFPSIRHYFRQNSRNLFTWREADIIGPLTYPNTTWTKPWDRIPKILELAANDGFDFKRYDKNNDNKIENNELGIFVIDNYSEHHGATRFRCVNINQNGRQIEICNSVAFAGHNAGFDLNAHELSHILGTHDIYGTSCHSEFNTLMSCSHIPDLTFHLDPYHKMRLGWTPPKIYDLNNGSGTATLSNPQSFPEAIGNHDFDGGPIILYDSRRGTDEYFLLEYRNPNYNSNLFTGHNYDANAAANGLLIWYVNQRPNHSPEFLSMVWPGNDGMLTTSLSGDDIRGIYLGKDVILPGSDGEIQSVNNLNGDDFVVHEGAVYSSPFIRNVSERGRSMVFINDNGTLKANGDPVTDNKVSPTWLDGTPLGISIQLSGSIENGKNIVVDWGEAFTPFIKSMSPSKTLYGNRTNLIELAGKNVARDHATLYVDDGRNRYKIPTQNYGFHLYIDLKIPNAVPPGEYKMYFESTSNSTVRSNIIEVSVVHPSTAIDEKEVSTPDLGLKVYPSPIKSGQSLKLAYQLPTSGEVEISIVDLTGKQVRTLFPKQTQFMGDHHTEYPLTLPRGMYILNLKYEGISNTKKFLVL